MADEQTTVPTNENAPVVDPAASKDEGEKSDASPEVQPTQDGLVEEESKTQTVTEDTTEPLPATAETTQVPKEKGSAVISSQSREEELDILLERFRNAVDLPAFTKDKWTREHDTLVREFFTHPSERVLTMAIDNNNNNLVCSFGIKDYGTEHIVYFLRKSDSPVTLANYWQEIDYGRISSEALPELQQTMRGYFIPTMKKVDLPDSLKKDFTSHVHKFMASLNDTIYQQQGKTVLYIPQEDLGENLSDLSKDKDLTQRLETTMIHWTRQIKEVVNNQDIFTNAEVLGPLDEIKFWRNRTIDLSGISEQLEKPGVHRIVQVLEMSKSSYLAPFLTLSNLIQQGTAEAKNNLKFLDTLTEPCMKLAEATPEDVHTLIPPILDRIRMIWNISLHYNTHERVTSLLRKVSNEIISRCCANIHLEQIFNENVFSAMSALERSIQCSAEWRKLYKKTVAAIERSTRDASKHWTFKEASIFAQIEAFTRRCRDLLEVCEGQVQFTRRKPNGNQIDMPVFGGTRGPHIYKSLCDNEKVFAMHLEKLRTLDYDALDVRATRWHEDFNTQFKNSLRDLEVMTQNIINTAFNNVSTVAGGVELLEAFQVLAWCESIKRCVEKKVTDVLSSFIKQCAQYKRHFESNRHAPPVHPDEPKNGGGADWTSGLRREIAQDWKYLYSVVQSMDQSMVRVDVVDEAKSEYQALMAVFNEYIIKQYYDWMTTLAGIDQAAMQKKLERPLMQRIDIKTGLPINNKRQNSTVPTRIESNFDKDLLKLFNEVTFWQRFGGEHPIPYLALDIAHQRDNLRLLRENVMLVITDYNQILDQLNTEEQLLFREQLRRLDRRVNAGLNRFTWASKGVIEWYVKDCRKHCSTSFSLAMQFKSQNADILKACRSMSKLSLLSLKRNYVYDDGVFVAEQDIHRKKVRERLQTLRQRIEKNIREMYEIFSADPTDIQQRWKQYVLSVETKIENALRECLKLSLKEFNKCINGDGKNDPQPLFKTNAILKDNVIVFEPSMVSLTARVNSVCKALVSVVSCVDRLNVFGDQRDEAVEERASFYDVLSNETEILDVLVSIMNGLSANSSEMDKYLSYWDKYKFLWDVDKDAFLRRYSKANRPLSQYNIDITRYRDQQAAVQGEELATSILFMRAECGLLKQKLVRHCVDWQQCFTGILNNIAKTELESLITMFRENTLQLTTKPETLVELATKVNLLQDLVANKEQTAAKFGPIQDKYASLQKFDVQPTEEEQGWLSVLHIQWEEFLTMMKRAETMLQGSKATMKQDLEIAVENLGSTTKEARKSAVARLPFSDELSIAEANEKIKEQKDVMNQFRAKEADLIPGMQIFGIDAPSYQDLQDTERDIDLLTRNWTIAQEWENKWEEFKSGVFSGLDVEAAVILAAGFNKKIVKLGRAIKALGRPWKCWLAIQERVKQFLATMPLIRDLRNPAIRPRHWQQLKDELRKDFNPNDESFTLEQVFTLGLHLYKDTIGTISNNANKELAIETALDEIEVAWKEVDIEMAEFKGVYYKIRSTEDLYTQLEDNQVQLSTMKASRFYAVFEKRITYWEKGLNMISEVIELALAVQRQWMYLESIFMSSEDIRKQLPLEAKLFDQVNESYKVITQAICDESNAYKATHKEGVLDELTNMDNKLAKIQKSLDAYLETKRQFFPRFYFLSNEDLLEILGQQKDPEQVQKHIIKCFVGIKYLILMLPGVAGNRTVECTGLQAPDGETIPLVRNVIIDGPVEKWLVLIEEAMCLALRKQIQGTVSSFKGKKDKWVRDWPGQLLIVKGKMEFTAMCHKALIKIQAGNKKALKQVKKKQIKYIAELCDMVRGQLTKIERKKVVALITMEIHSRDVEERMIKGGCAKVEDFLWTSQLRYTYFKDQGPEGFGDVDVRQTNTVQVFGYEYQGNNGRLVVTALTDRCILTLTTALYLQRGGSPLGPAGTGKTETVKDLGKNLAKYVVVFNCSDSMDYLSVGRMFSGLVQQGGWGCFDEFNRIQIEVLSVIGQQVMSIMMAIRAEKTSFDFMGTQIRCNWNCGIFITMNPGYAGRTELPDSLKALFRPCAMMKPDMAQIAEVMLASQGFRDARPLGKKVTVLYELMMQQLSKQDHYDFGLRAMASCLACAGALKRADQQGSEELILLRALRDMNISKFITADKELFLLLLADLFPGLELPVTDYGTLWTSLEDALVAQGLEPIEVIIRKCIQLYETKATRHCNMLVGFTLGGKSVCWKTLAIAKTAMNAAGDKKELLVKTHKLNPKSLSLNELYGAYDLSTMEWQDGVLATIFRQCAYDLKKQENWIVLDGPVDTLWIESMNTVMDNNKQLCLINGDRIAMGEFHSMVFEVQDLSVASPATVSRAGMVYVDVADLGYEPYLLAWMKRNFEREDEIGIYNGLFQKYIDPLLDFKTRYVSELIPQSNFSVVISMCSLYEQLYKDDANNLQVIGKDAPEGHWSYVEKWFTFAMTWTVCGTADEEGRKKFDTQVREIEAQYPPQHTIYEYCVDVQTKDWKLWEERVNTSWRPVKGAPFFKMIVPTVDTVRNSFVVANHMKSSRPVMLVGNTGTGKTVIGEQFLESLGDIMTLVINFSSASTSNSTQDIIEGNMEKRSRNQYGPPGGKSMVCFVDDFNMPAKDTFGSQPPIELFRQWMEYDGWYDRGKCTWRFIQDMSLMVSMGKPGGGRSVISQRMQSQFSMLNFTFPQDTQIQRIFESILSPQLSEFSDDIKQLAKPMVTATVDLYNFMVNNFKPTPVKCHYLFNLRDIAKVIQGMLYADVAFIDNKESMLRLWVHECSRVFSDRLISYEDREKLISSVRELSSTHFDTQYDDIMEGVADASLGPIFIDFMSEPVGEGGNKPYEEVKEITKLRALMEEKLDDFNVEPGFTPMELVLFPDAMCHVARISRVLSQPRGNCLLLGVGGSGRQSLTRLASYINDYKVFQIKITKNYRSLEFHEDLKALYMLAGVENKATCFLMPDTQIKQESFLEDINNVLSSGVVPGLFLPDETAPIIDGVRDLAKKSGIGETHDELWKFFISQVRANLHVVLAMSPIGDAFRNRVRMYPALVNNTTIDKFFDWPEVALNEVAVSFLDEVDISGEGLKGKLAAVFAHAHEDVLTASSKILKQLRRNIYVTPTSYLELVKSYRAMLKSKRTELGIARDRLKNGTTKLDEAKVQVEQMSVELEKKKIVVAKSQKDCEELLVVIVSERRAADEKQKVVEKDADRISKEAASANAIATDCEADLGRALPALEKAMEEVDKLDKSSITEVKSFSTPPDAVVMVMAAVMVLFKGKQDWKSAKLKLGESDFLHQIKNYNKDNISNSMLNKIRKFTKKAEFAPEVVKSKSFAAGSLCVWVCAMEIYSTVFREVAPKRAKLKKAMDGLAKSEKSLAKAKAALAEVVAQVQKLADQYDTSVGEKNRLRQEAEDLELKLDRADKLVGGLAGERIRWGENVDAFNEQITALVGDCLIASAFGSYCGPFDSDYRNSLITTWQAQVKQKQIPYDPAFSFSSFLAKPTDVKEWNVDGLPADDFSTENGVIVTGGRRWALMIDPQAQANRWIKNMYGKELRVCDLKSKDYLRELENAIQFGMPYLLQDVLEEMDPSLDPVLGKQIIKLGSREVMRLGDKELDYDHNFKFFVTTKLANPHYSPEMSTKVTIVNFAVKEQGLVAQLLAIVVQEEKPSLEQQNSELVIAVARGNRQLYELEDDILRLLSTAEGSLLDDPELVNTLQNSKTISNEVTEQLEIAEETRKTIEVARQSFNPIAVRAAILYFILTDLAVVDPMYQFSLAAYVQLFLKSIALSKDSTGLDRQDPGNEIAARIFAINDYHTLAMYKQTCIGLFGKHKLLLSYQVSVKILAQQGKINLEEADYLLRGSTVLDRSLQPTNSEPEWVDQQMWDNICGADNLESLTGLVQSFQTMGKDWKSWFMSPNPESTPLPGDWGNKLDSMQCMVVLRCVRPDRLTQAVTSYVTENIGRAFVEPPPFDLDAVFKNSAPRTPMIFILSPGVDPAHHIQTLCNDKDLTLEQCALGQGQAPIATRMLTDGVKHGGWVYLANCHLSISWMPALEKLIDNFCNDVVPHKDFRLWLSSSPHPDFPIAVLQMSIKMTTEPPEGLKANLGRLYDSISEERFERSPDAIKYKYKRLVFCLCWFHALILERRKFRSLGWAIPYEFNDSDFQICEDILGIYLAEYQENTPFDALRYLIAEANYGGRVTDDWDRRLLNVYMTQFLCEEAISVPNFMVSTAEQYFVPSDGEKSSYKKYISRLPTEDPTDAFGQHGNAQVASQRMNTVDLLATLLDMQPRVVTEGGETDDDKVTKIIRDINENLVDPFDLFVVNEQLDSRSDPDPLKEVLKQEVDRYNALIRVLKTSVVDLDDGIQGLVSITPELENVYDSLLAGRVPTSWSFAYPSLKPLGSWTGNFFERIAQIKRWVYQGLPLVRTCSVVVCYLLACFLSLTFFFFSHFPPSFCVF